MEVTSYIQYFQYAKKDRLRLVYYGCSTVPQDIIGSLFLAGRDFACERSLMKRADAGGYSKGGARLLPVRCLPGQADLVSGRANCVYVGQGSCDKL